MSTPSKDENTLQGYLLNIKSADPDGSNSRIEFMLQQKEETKRVLYFSPKSKKRTALEELNMSPVKITCFRKNMKSGDYIMDHDTVISPETQLDFQPLNMQELKLKDVEKCAIESMITVTAKVRSKSTITKKNGLPYQVIAVSDDSASIRLILWKDYVNSCEQSKTYVFSNIKVKRDKEYGHVFLGTAYGNDTIITEAEDIGKVSTAESSSMVQVGEKHYTGDVVSIGRITRLIQCANCPKKVEKVDGLYTCVPCNASMRLKFCRKRLVMNLIVMDVHEKSMTCQYSTMSWMIS